MKLSKIIQFCIACVNQSNIRQYLRFPSIISLLILVPVQMHQDVANKISLVVNKDLPSWKAMNTVAHLSANFGKYLGEKKLFDTGDYFISADGVEIPRNTQYAIIIFETDHDTLQQFVRVSRSFNDVKLMYFIKEMIDTSDDAEIASSVGRKNFESIDFLGVGLYGNNKLLKAYTESFKLWSTEMNIN